MTFLRGSSLVQSAATVSQPIFLLFRFVARSLEIFTLARLDAVRKERSGAEEEKEGDPPPPRFRPGTWTEIIRSRYEGYLFGSWVVREEDIRERRGGGGATRRATAAPSSSSCYPFFFRGAHFQLGEIMFGSVFSSVRLPRPRRGNKLSAWGNLFM